MNQQVNVNLTLTLEVDATFDKEQISEFVNDTMINVVSTKQIALDSFKIDHIAEEAEIYGNDESLSELTPWRFVEKFYPNYCHSNLIAYNNDLSVIIEQKGDCEEGSCAQQVWESLSEDIERVNEEYDGSCRIIYEKAIQAFIESHHNLVRS